MTCKLSERAAAPGLTCYAAAFKCNIYQCASAEAKDAAATAKHIGLALPNQPPLHDTQSPECHISCTSHQVCCPSARLAPPPLPRGAHTLLGEPCSLPCL